MKRIDAIEEIMELVTDEVIIATTGMISREVCYICDRPRNFYMMGSMGNALAIGLGIAINSAHKVLVLSGDASALMSLGTMALHKKLNPPNIKHYIFDNGCHASTGGQPTCSDSVDFSMLAPNTEVISVSNEKGNAPRIKLSPKEIMKRFSNAIRIDIP